MINLFQEIKKTILIFKIFIKITPPKLYKRIFKLGMLKVFGKRYPSSAVIGLTYRCKLNCSHCSAGIYLKNESYELKTDEIKKLLDDIYKLNVPRINITGGDPFLRDDLYEIILYASKRFIVILESNGMDLDFEKIKKLKECNLSCLAVSIDSPYPMVHDKLRKKEGLFKEAIETLFTAKKLRLPTIISTYITSQNIDVNYLVELKKICKLTGALAIRVLPLRPIGNSVENYNSSDFLNETDEIKLEKILDKGVFYFRGIPGGNVCGIFSRNTFYISPYGDVQPCPYLPISFGNLKSDELGIILNKMWNHEIFKNVENLKCLVTNRKFMEKNLNNSKKFPLKV